MLLGGIEIKQIDIFAEEALEKIYKRIERYTLGIGRAKALRCEKTQEIFDFRLSHLVVPPHANS